MDILAARKKAAEKARAEKKAAPPQVSEPQEGATNETAGRGEAVAAGPVQAPQVPDAAAPAASGPDGPASSSSEGAAETTAEEMELLSFRMGGEEYAVLVDDVKEVLKLRDLTIVPNAPDYVLGVMSLRGTMLPVMDLCKRLGIRRSPSDEKSRILVVSPDEEDAGLMVDRVSGVLRIMPDAIKPVPENIEHGAEFLRGIVRREDKLYILLDLVKAVNG
jgi:purine-binding chemotaxis protein CheW